MLILALETSGAAASAALVDEYITIAEASVSQPFAQASVPRVKKTHSETLMPMLEQMFSMTGIDISAVDYIACTSGPGSFTGLRVGAATAKGLAFSAEKPLIAVPTLDAMAYTVANLAVSNSAQIWTVPMLDARRGQVYAAVYRCAASAGRVTDYLAEPVENVLARLLESIGNSESTCHQIVFLGDGAQMHQELIESIIKGERLKDDLHDSFANTMYGKKKTGIIFAPPCHNRLRAACVAGCAFEMARRGEYADESEFSLLYIRKPQAERERLEKLSKGKE